MLILKNCTSVYVWWEISYFSFTVFSKIKSIFLKLWQSSIAICNWQFSLKTHLTGQNSHKILSHEIYKYYSAFVCLRSITVKNGCYTLLFKEEMFSFWSKHSMPFSIKVNPQMWSTDGMSSSMQMRKICLCNTFAIYLCVFCFVFCFLSNIWEGFQNVSASVTSFWRYLKFKEILGEMETQFLSTWKCHRFLNNKPNYFSPLITRFYSQVEGHEPAVLIVKTMDEEVFDINWLYF